ncbi:hypothetical protein [Criibacterium bergeronii]|uniref:Uncharacterized protein n=1 Tax=Criibacterium bergeronii TaxID=1871336 RepID=A0A371IL95_9FIRM|nr:hypothetical protein [Criibacterium bergeronii]MBS6064147.1 hypothetical protein [Peptostreptococcaceae bacterium]RDY21259.1 hypothetical protein BBG48_005600 [Criibacterium bergeronii]
MAKTFGDYLAGAGYFLLDTTREAVLRHDDETAQQEREAGISILAAALYESKIKDTEIVRLLQKYYGLRESEAQEQIRIERTINYPCCELESYLMSTEGFSQQEAQDYIIDHGTVDMLRQERGLWKLSPKELLKRIE